MGNEIIDSYRSYLQSQCSYYSPEAPEYLSGEIIRMWFNRKCLRREMVSQEAELLKIDGVLSGLFYDQKRRLSRLGRNGGWSKWLKQNKIPRSTADRLVLEHVEFFGLQHELPHREQIEPLEGNVCLAACRTSDKFEQTLKTPRSKMMFLRCLADRFGFEVDVEPDGSVRLSTPSPVNDEDFDCTVPNVMTIAKDGAVVPVNYDLQDEEGEGDSTFQSPLSSGDLL
jgi:hypothetical protein